MATSLLRAPLWTLRLVFEIAMAIIAGSWAIRVGFATMLWRLREVRDVLRVQWLGCDGVYHESDGCGSERRVASQVAA